MRLLVVGRLNGQLALAVKMAMSAGACDKLALPLIRSVSSNPGIRNKTPTLPVLMMFYIN